MRTTDRYLLTKAWPKLRSLNLNLLSNCSLQFLALKTVRRFLGYTTVNITQSGARQCLATKIDVFTRSNLLNHRKKKRKVADLLAVRQTVRTLYHYAVSSAVTISRSGRPCSINLAGLGRKRWWYKLFPRHSLMLAKENYDIPQVSWASFQNECSNFPHTSTQLNRLAMG
jgi:hypothetical protein